MASFSDEVKARIRRALGYMGQSETQAISFGLVINAEYLYLLNARMDGDVHEQPFVNIVVEELGRVEATDEQIFAAQKRLAAKQIGSITTNDAEFEQLIKARNYWVSRLAGHLGVPLYNPSAGGGINVRVNHG